MDSKEDLTEGNIAVIIFFILCFAIGISLMLDYIL